MLTTRQRYLLAITDLWQGFNLATFRDRLLLQKRMFFAAAVGIDLGYSHTWYVRGPYSPSLTRDAYDIEGVLNRVGIPEEVVPEYLPEQTKARLKGLAEAFGEDWNDPRKMELYASLYYLAKSESTSEPTRLAEKLSNFKEYYQENEAREALDFLKKKGLING